MIHKYRLDRFIDIVKSYHAAQGKKSKPIKYDKWIKWTFGIGLILYIVAISFGAFNYFILDGKSNCVRLLGLITLLLSYLILIGQQLIFIFSAFESFREYFKYPFGIVLSDMSDKHENNMDLVKKLQIFSCEELKYFKSSMLTKQNSLKIRTSILIGKFSSLGVFPAMLAILASPSWLGDANTAVTIISLALAGLYPLGLMVKSWSEKIFSLSANIDTAIDLKNQ